MLCVIISIFAGLISKASLCVELAVGTMWRHSTDINKNAGNNTSWNTNIACNITSTQIRRDPIKVKVLDSGKVVGQGSVKALPLLSKSGASTKLKCELSNNGEPAGAVFLYASFKSASETEKDKPVPVGDMRGPDKTEKEQIKAVSSSYTFNIILSYCANILGYGKRECSTGRSFC